MPIEFPASRTLEPELPALRTLYELLAALTRAETIEEVYDAGLTSLLQATAADRAAVLRFDDAGVMRFVSWRGLSAEYREAVTGHTPWAPGTRDAQPILVPDVRFDSGLRAYGDWFARERIGALAFIPLALDGGVFGKFMLYYPRPHEFPGEEITIAQTIAGHIALASERRRAEAARIQSERRLQAVLDNTHAVIFMKDVEGRYTLVNRRYEELFGRGVIGKTDYDLFPPEIADRFRANDEAVVSGRKPLTIEESAPHAEGIHSYVSVKFPIQGEDGEVAGVCGIASDVTEYKLFEAASVRLAAIVQDSEDAILSHDLEGLITSWNQGAQRLYGYSAEEVLGKSITILVNPEQRDEMTGILDRLRQGERVTQHETVRRKKDGTLVEVSLTVSPIRGVSGHVVGASKIARDITDRQRAHRERADLLAREQAARRRAELLNRIGPALVAELDLQKIVQAVTDAATTLVGAEFGAFFHNVVNAKGESYMLYTLSGAFREAFSQFPMPRNTAVFAPTFSGRGIVRSGDITQDPRYGQSAPHHGLPKGHLPVRSYLAVPVVSRGGEVVGGLFFGHSSPGRFEAEHEEILTGVAAQAAIAIDNARLFERAQWTQSELKRSNEELRQSNHDLETFAYSASHDLQEPLRTIAISAQLLEMNCADQLGAAGSAFLSNILKGTRSMAELLNDILAYTTVTRKTAQAPPPTDTQQVLTHVVEVLKETIQSTQAAVTWDELPVIHAHEARLSQVFQNLISNALKYTRREPPRVHVSATQGDGAAIFSVTDNGIGIESRYGEQIFGLFKRLHGRDRYPGSGIGLAICQRIVEQYGGRIWLEKSTPGQGSTFCFSIPTRPVEW